MNAHILCALAMVFYALEIFVTDHKLKTIHPRFVTMCYAGGVFLFASLSVAQAQIANSDVKKPEGSQWIFIILMVLASFIAASSHFTALNKNAGAVQLSMYYALLPVVAAVFEAIFSAKWPSWREYVAWLCAALALYLVSNSE